MADTKISALDAAGTLDGTELIPVVKDGLNKSATPSTIKTFAVGNGLTVRNASTVANPVSTLVFANGTVTDGGDGTATVSGLVANPMTTGGDLIYGGASGVPTRLANGSAGQLLQSNGTTLAPSWVDAPTGGGGMTTKTLDASQTRPGDTTTYAAGDVMCNSTSAPTILSFANAAAANAGGGVIQGATFICSAAQVLVPEYDLYLFDTTVTMQNDNAAFAPSDAEMLTCIGVIRFPGALFVIAGANGTIDVDNISKAFNCAAGSTTIYGVMVARNAYIPTSAEVWKIRLKVLQD